MKNILIASDLSVESVTSFNYAIYMAHLANAKLIVLHAYHLPTLNEADKLDNKATTLLDCMEANYPNFAQIIKKNHSKEVLQNIQFEYLHAHKLQVDKVADIIKKSQIDLMVIDARPKRGIQEIVFGNYLEEVMDKIKSCPVIAVPQNAVFKPLKNIWYATVMLTPVETLVQLRDFTAIFSQKLHLVHVIVEPTRSYAEKVKHFKERVETAFNKQMDYSFKEIEDADVEAALLQNLEQENADMMIMVERPKSAFDRLLMNSMTELMALNATTPIAIFHEKETHH